jgi:hypothetical protein
VARDATRDTLIKVAQSLGPEHVGFIVKELKHALTKGYQVHLIVRSRAWRVIVLIFFMNRGTCSATL